MRHILVVGASLAGVSAVEGLRAGGFDGAITLVDEQEVGPYDRPPLSKQALQEDIDLAALKLRPESWAEEHRVHLRLGQRARQLDAAGRAVELADGDRLGFDGLVIATGSAARPLVVPGVEGAPVHLLRTIDDAAALRDRLVRARRVVVVGAGFIGLEVASVARALGTEVTVLDVAPVPLAAVFGPRIGAWFAALHASRGVRIRCDTAVAELVSRPDGATDVVLASGERIAADAIVAGIGAAPATGWLTDSGLELDDGIVCGADLSTSVPQIVAAGDLARWPNPQYDETMRVEHWTNAVEQGRHAAATLLGDARPYSSVPSFWTDQHDAKVRFVGRASPDDDLAIEHDSDDALVAVFGRDGVVRGALCVNRPRHLAHYRRLIATRAPWATSISSADPVRT